MRRELFYEVYWMVRFSLAALVKYWGMGTRSTIDLFGRVKIYSFEAVSFLLFPRLF